MLSQARLELKGIDKRFPGVHALKSVDFDLMPGEIHSLVGENGAGKSTLINVMIGLYQPDGGSVFYNGEKTVFNTPKSAVEKGIAIVPQELNLIPELTVAENIFIGVKKLKKSVLPLVDWKKIYADAEAAIDRLGVKIDVRQQVGKMSVANQQLVQIARAITFGAQVLIFDEPTACLTLKEGERLLEMIEGFRAEGKSLVFVSHHMDEVMRISDRITVMRDGTRVEVLNRKDVTIPRLIHGMVGRETTYERTVHRVPEDAPTILEVNDLCRRREFEHISFSMRKGEIFGIAGLVGAGRTELVSTIFGDRQPDSGQIKLFGQEIQPKHPREAIELGLGYLPEERRAQAILPILPVRENISIADINSYFRFPMLNLRQERSIAEEYIKKLHIKCSSMEQKIGQLSGGNQQKVILARWLALNTKLLILDEPTRGIDVLAKAEIHRLIRACADEGMGALVVSSEMEELISLCNRIMIMHEGKLKAIVDTEELTSDRILELALA